MEQIGAYHQDSSYPRPFVTWAKKTRPTSFKEWNSLGDHQGQYNHNKRSFSMLWGLVMRDRQQRNFAGDEAD